MVLSLTEKLTHLLQSFSGFYPESGLIVLFIILIITDLVFQKRAYCPTRWVALLGLSGILYLSSEQCCIPTDKGYPLFLGLLQMTNLAILLKLLFGVLGILTILFSWTERKTYTQRGEFFSILVGLIFGLHIMVMSRNLLMLYLGIELVSLSSYVLTYFSENRKSANGSLRYLLFGAMSSAVMLYGMSWLYGLTGSLMFTEPSFWTALASQPTVLASSALILALGGLLFKISAVPFHVWAPDIYDAAPIAIVSFFSIAPKIAALAVFAIVSYSGASQWSGFQSLVAVLALASITIGNFGALAQQNARRMMAYSSIAHAGFLMIGIAAGSTFALQSFLFYIVIYLFMNLAAFLLIHWLERFTQSSTIVAYEGLGSRSVGIGIALIIAMIALAGLPPTAGFTAKLLIFSSLWEAYQQSGNLMLAVLFGWGLLNVAVSVFYYLRIPYILFFKKSTREAPLPFTIHWAEVLLLVGVLAPVVILFFKSDLLTESLSVFLR